MTRIGRSHAYGVIPHDNPRFALDGYSRFNTIFRIAKISVGDELTSTAMLRSSHGMSAWGHSRPCRDDRYWRKAAVHAQRHLLVDKHELEMESVCK